jgi:cell division initiation protein
MAYSPVELRHIKISRGLFGYRRGATDRVLTDVAESFSDVWRERADLQDKVEQLEADLVRHRELESLLRTTLVSAERTSEELREQARREADLVVAEAHAEARAVTRRAAADRERLLSHAHQVRAKLRSALEVIDEADIGEEIGAESEAA